MERSFRLIDYYLPPGEGFVLESLVATTYRVDFEFFEEELLAAALGVRSSVSRMRAFRSELERKLQKAEVSVLYDLGGCDRLARLSPRIDAIPVVARKLHSKISLLMWVREDRAVGAPHCRIGESDPTGIPPQLRVHRVPGLWREDYATAYPTDDCYPARSADRRGIASSATFTSVGKICSPSRSSSKRNTRT